MSPRDPSPEFERFRHTLQAAGLNLVGAVSARSAHETLIGEAIPSALESARTLLVCGSGGGTHWERLSAADRTLDHPIEQASRRVLREAAVHLPQGHLLGPEETNAFDLRALGERAGLGRLSPHLLMLIHPKYGPWVSIRGLVMTALEVAPTPLATDFDPCAPCSRPCLDACPAGAYSRERPWEFARCAAHRLQERAPAQHCADACRSRLACVVGPEHAYSPEEFRHRHRAGLPTIRRLVDGS